MVKSGMVGEEDGAPEGIAPNLNLQAEAAALEAARRGRRFESGPDVSTYGTAAKIADPDQNDPREGFRLAMYFINSRTSPLGVGQVSSYDIGPIMAAMCSKALGFRINVDEFRAIEAIDSEIKATLAVDDKRFGEYEVPDGMGGRETVRVSNPNLVSALTKVAKYRVEKADIYEEDGRGFQAEVYPPDLTVEEDKGLRSYYRLLRQREAHLKNVAGPMYDHLKQGVELPERLVRIDVGIAKWEELETKGKLDDPGKLKLTELRKQKKMVNEQIKINRLGLKDEVDQTQKGGQPEMLGWEEATTALSGIVDNINGCAQWLQTAYDLDSLKKLWMYSQGQMEPMHPSSLEKVVKWLPGFESGFRAISALALGRYGIGSNGEMYVSGRYGMGFVDADGYLVDMGEAYDGAGNLLPRIVELGENQVFRNGRVMEVTRTAGRSKSGWVQDGDKRVEIYDRNILYEQGKMLHDEDIIEWLDKINNFSLAKGGGSNAVTWVGVEMAREFFEQSMLSNWYGVARDSKGRLYYKYEETVSSDPDSKAVKMGKMWQGGDEGTTYPSFVNDLGKLTVTRWKQLSELGKGRKHGLYPLLAHLPENIVVPLMSENTVRSIIDKGGMQKVFKEMSSVEKMKSYWVSIFKGIAVYETVSSWIVGAKDVLKANEELFALLMQPQILEGLNKDIDLSITFFDPWEAARLKVNVVLAAVESVAKEFGSEEFISGLPSIGTEGHLYEYVTEKVSTGKIKDKSENSEMVRAFKILARTGFVGSVDDVGKIISRVKSAFQGKSELTYSLSELKRDFGEGFVSRILSERERRLGVVKTNRREKT